MNSRLKKGLLLVIAIGLFASCSEVSKKVEDKLDELNNKVGQLDSLVNSEVDKVINLDTLINLESIKVKKLDSLINRSTSKIDSIATEKIELLKEIVK